MKSSERHDLQRNELMELLKDPGELLRRYGLTVLIVVVALVLAIFLIFRASTAESLKWQRAWYPLQEAVDNGDEEQLRSVAQDTHAEKLVRAWAYVKHGELLYNKSQKEPYLADRQGRDELLSQAIESYGKAIDIGQKWVEIVGQATVQMGVCYESLGKDDLARDKYASIISEGEDRFGGTIWLIQAQGRKTFLDDTADMKVDFR